VLETFDPRDLLARILMHVAEPRAHLVRHYGEYAVAARAKRRRHEQPIEYGRDLPSPGLVASDDDPSPAERRASSHNSRAMTGVPGPINARIVSVGLPAATSSYLPETVLEVHYTIPLKSYSLSSTVTFTADMYIGHFALAFGSRKIRGSCI